MLFGISGQNFDNFILTPCSLKFVQKPYKTSRHIFQLKAWISIRGIPEGGGGGAGLQTFIRGIEVLSHGKCVKQNTNKQKILYKKFNTTSTEAKERYSVVKQTKNR